MQHYIYLNHNTRLDVLSHTLLKILVP